MFYIAKPVVLSFEDEIIKTQVEGMIGSLGDIEFCSYLSKLIEDDIYSRMLKKSTRSQADNSVIIENSPSTSVAVTQGFNPNDINELINKVNLLLEKGVQFNNNVGGPPSNLYSKAPSQGEIIEPKEIESTDTDFVPVVAPKKKKNKLGLKNKNLGAALSKMSEMQKK